jgi:hypothetical protein
MAHHRPAPLALACGGFGAALARRRQPRRVRQGGLPAPARDPAHPAVDARQGQCHRGNSPVDDQHQAASRPPAAPRLHHLPHPVHTGLVPARASRLGRPAPRGTKGQRPHPPTPGHWHQAHHRDPFQADTAPDVCLRGAHRIPVTTCRLDLPARPALHRIVRPKNARRSRGDQRRDQPPEQHPTPRAGRPRRSVQDPMIVREAALCRQPHHPYGRRHRACTRGEHGPQESELSMGPDPVRQQWCKTGQDPYDGFGQGRQAMSSFDRMHFGRDHLSSGTSRPSAYSKWPKSSDTDVKIPVVKVFSLLRGSAGSRDSPDVPGV